ncbi:hypothetical protein, partial [Acinetobacter baumannii]|uniref:hypothetical protein n=1 Tax=Acinetobacter baumannii TaxID=470 RepID=UPI001BB4682A
MLGLLFLSEGLALVYDTRKDHLLSAAAAKAEAQRKSDADAAETRRKAEVGALQERLNEASSKVAELDKLRQPRRFTPEQRAKLAEFVTKNTTGKLKFVIKASAMADDASAYANEIASAFNAPPISWQVRVDSAI